MTKFKPGDRVRNKNGDAFSNGDFVVEVARSPFDGYGTYRNDNIVWLNTGQGTSADGPTNTHSTYLELVPIDREWQEATQEEIATLAKFGIVFEVESRVERIRIKRED